MAWSYKTVGALTNTPQTAIAYPSGIAAGDILFCAVGDDTAGKTFTLSDSGFISIGSLSVDVSLQLWWKIATGSESGNFTVSGGGDWGQCVRFSGGPTTLTGNVNNTSIASGLAFGTVIPWNAMTVSASNCLIIGIGYAYDNSDSISSGLDVPSPWTNQIGSNYQQWDVFGWDYVIQTTDTNISAGQFSPSNSSSGLNQGSILAALVPAGAAAPPAYAQITPPGPGVSPNKQTTFQNRNLATLPVIIPITGLGMGGAQARGQVFSLASIGAVPIPGPGNDRSQQLQFFSLLLQKSTSPQVTEYGRAMGGVQAYGNLVALATMQGRAMSGAVAGSAALYIVSSRAGLDRNMARGPGISSDWPQTFILRPLATQKTTSFIEGIAMAGAMARGLPGGGAALLGVALAGGMSKGNLLGGAPLFGRGMGGGMWQGSGIARIPASALGMGGMMGYGAAHLIIPYPGYTLGQAQQILATAGFTINPVIIWQYSTTVPYYYVISQNPVAGTVMTYQETPIQLTVSAGPPPPSLVDVDVPSLIGELLLTGIQVLASQDLNLGTVTYIQSATIPINSITGQSPSAGTLVTPYSSVNLTVCSGPPQDTLVGDLYTVPNVSAT
jgi:hypothetical protein